LSDAPKHNDASKRDRAAHAGDTADTPREDDTLQLLAEDFSVTKEKRETGRVRVSTHTHEREAVVDEDLEREHIEIEKVPVGRRIHAVPDVRREGDTTIVPVVEEVLHVERQLMLKEEVRIRRVRTTERHRERVTLRHQEAVIKRLPHDPLEVDAISKKPKTAKDQKG
jgi:uncharacterized protein (TIGR02271 family)